MSKQTYPKGYSPMSDPTEVLRNMRGNVHNALLLKNYVEADYIMSLIVEVEAIWAEQTARGW